MFGKQKGRYRYYACQPGLNNRGLVAERFADHPSSVWVREDHLLAGTGAFFAARVFGPHRREQLAADFDALHETAATGRASALRAAHRALADIEHKQGRLVHSLESNDDPDGILFGRIRDRLSALEAERRAKIVRIAELEKEQAAAAQHDVSLLDRLPVLDVHDLWEYPDDKLRPLLDAFRLELRVNKLDGDVQIRVVLTDDLVDALTRAFDAAGFVRDEASERGRLFPFFDVPPGGIEPPSTG